MRPGHRPKERPLKQVSPTAVSFNLDWHGKVLEVVVVCCDLTHSLAEGQVLDATFCLLERSGFGCGLRFFFLFGLFLYTLGISLFTQDFQVPYVCVFLAGPWYFA